MFVIACFPMPPPSGPGRGVAGVGEKVKAGVGCLHRRCQGAHAGFDFHTDLTLRLAQIVVRLQVQPECRGSARAGSDSVRESS